MSRLYVRFRDGTKGVYDIEMSKETFDYEEAVLLIEEHEIKLVQVMFRSV